ncbi:MULTISPECIES: chemotaxis protein CheW [unclassified Novosphingobium]|uniref:chemotaxis protein CheW n=1 Tax=unclassified Novosphingobium TaxID=2644732 RepID=UPI000D316611|nr:MULTISPECIES: chemotaxis protein CheW [unclassified Novosphingobium]PTR11940.1 purine-binding chemotaxis protein CheW [Novosphingobium sp. GV055]PUB04980.1 purine-binding chemotaxis protein CheW [Novosphingobium sp. GV061]PUB21299.1 purine-binding chemotaxis protein CheW [Novosphingobium sp. GV079]PUB43025.1 purine-binding chemotaxis protein CheW [Novosphingobium sp. GV027]
MTAPRSLAEAPARDDLQVVTFGLGREVFAVPVVLVREILDYQVPSHMPGGPVHFLGLTDVRGQGVPTLDFRRRLGLPSVEPTLATRIIILDVPLPDRTLALGVVIDRVLAVVTVPVDRIEAAPDIGTAWNAGFVQGVVREADGFIVILDLPRIFAGDDPVHAAGTATVENAAGGRLAMSTAA